MLISLNIRPLITYSSISLRGSGLGGFWQPKMGRSGMVGGTNLDPCRETNLDLLHVVIPCHMLYMLHHVALVDYLVAEG